MGVIKVALLFLALAQDHARGIPMKQDYGGKDTTPRPPPPPPTLPTSTTPPPRPTPTPTVPYARPTTTAPPATTREPRAENYKAPPQQPQPGSWPFKPPAFAQGPKQIVPGFGPPQPPATAPGYRGPCPPAVCPPCPCRLTQRSVPESDDADGTQPDPSLDDDHPRERRSAPGSDYWHDVGAPDPYLLQTNWAYAAKTSISNQLDQYGMPLHYGKIDSSDFNYPTDFNLFNTPGRTQNLLMQSGFYVLNGPLRVSLDPTGDLVGPLPNRPDTFTTLILSEGVFRVSTVQKNNIFKMQDPTTGVIFIVNCLAQPTFGSCSNLRKFG